MRILVVEDERKLAQALASTLQAEHYEVVLAPTGEDGCLGANALLDLMLPGRNGLEILQTLRKRQVQSPVLILPVHERRGGGPRFAFTHRWRNPHPRLSSGGAVAVLICVVPYLALTPRIGVSTTGTASLTRPPIDPRSPHSPAL